MKRFRIAELVLMVCTLVTARLPEAKAQVPIAVVENFSGVQAAVTNAASITPTNAVIQLRKNQGFALLPIFAGTAASVSNITFTLNVSADGTNYSTTGPLSYVVAMNGTNTVVGYKVFTPTDVGNVRYVKLSTIANGAASGGGGVGCLIDRVQYSFFNP